MKEQSIQSACDIVAANSTGRGFSTEQLVEQLRQLSTTIDSFYSEEVLVAKELAVPEVPALADWRSSLGKTTITCLLCGYTCKVLAPHLRVRHNMTTKEYRTQFGIPSKVSLLSKDSRTRRQQLAKSRDLGAVLQRAREAKGTKS
jgi:predicted transcriptional regulator